MELVNGKLLPINQTEKLLSMVKNMESFETREAALLKLNTFRISFPHFARLVWKNEFIINAVMEEIIISYPSMTTGLLTVEQAHRLSRTLSLIQSFADHPEVRRELLKTHILIHIFPFLKTMYQSSQYEFLRLGSLAVLLTLAESCDAAAITFLVVSGFTPIALVYMEFGTDMCKVNSIQIFRRMIDDDSYLKRISETEFLFRNIIDVLHKMILTLAVKPNAMILRHVVKTYLRLADNKDARMVLSICLPEQLRNQTFADCFKEDVVIERCLQKLTLALWFQSEVE